MSGQLRLNCAAAISTIDTAAAAKPGSVSLSPHPRPAVWRPQAPSRRCTDDVSEQLRRHRRSGLANLPTPWLSGAGRFDSAAEAMAARERRR